MNAQDLVERLARDGLTLAVAESCTGGLLSSAFVDVPGASKVFLGGVVAYADKVKAKLLEVEDNKFTTAGAVSATVAEDMAHGLRECIGADVNVAVTGIAGPTGGSRSKPVGTVWIAVLGPAHVINVHKYRFDGDRDSVRRQTVEKALLHVVQNVEEAEREGSVRDVPAAQG